MCLYLLESSVQISPAHIFEQGSSECWAKPLLKIGLTEFSSSCPWIDWGFCLSVRLPRESSLIFPYGGLLTLNCEGK
jgi:hypothetical protein